MEREKNQKVILAESGIEKKVTPRKWWVKYVYPKDVFMVFTKSGSYRAVCQTQSKAFFYGSDRTQCILYLEVEHFLSVSE